MISMESAMADVALRHLSFTPRHTNLPLAVVRPWPIIQVVWGGCSAPTSWGWVQDFQRIRDLRAEPVALTKVVVTKKEALDRMYALRRRQGGQRASGRALRPVVVAASGAPGKTDRTLNGS